MKHEIHEVQITNASSFGGGLPLAVIACCMALHTCDGSKIRDCNCSCNQPQYSEVQDEAQNDK